MQKLIRGQKSAKNSPIIRRPLYVDYFASSQPTRRNGFSTNGGRSSYNNGSTANARNGSTLRRSTTLNSRPTYSNGIRSSYNNTNGSRPSYNTNGTTSNTGDTYRRRRRSLSNESGNRASTTSNDNQADNGRRSDEPSRPVRFEIKNDNRSSTGTKCFDVRALKGNSNIKVIESKPTNCIKSESAEQVAEKIAPTNTNESPTRSRSPSSVTSRSSDNVRRSNAQKMKCFDVRAQNGRSSLTVVESKPIDYCTSDQESAAKKEKSLSRPKIESSPSTTTDESEEDIRENKPSMPMNGNHDDNKENKSSMPMNGCHDDNKENKSSMPMNGCHDDNKASTDLINKIHDLLLTDGSDLLRDHYIENLFAKTYSEPLVKNWLDLIGQSDKLDVLR